MKKACPICNEFFDNQEFCPAHFVELVSAHIDPAAQPNDEHASESTSETTNQLASSQNDESGGSLLDRISKRIGGAFKRKKSQDNIATDSGPKPAKKQTLELPPELREKAWVVSGSATSLHGVDVWPVECLTGEGRVPGKLVVYATGALTDTTTYQRLLHLGTSSVRTHLHAVGTLDRGHQVRASYELITVPGEWQSLTGWLSDSPPSEERALSLLHGVAALLEDSFQSGLFPISLDPSVLQRNADGQLRLVRFGALWNTSPTVTTAVYRPEFAHAGSLLPSPWAAPELKGRLVVTPQSLAFSLAQLLAAALLGQPPSQHEVQAGLVPFSSIKNPELARILMGGLWPHADGRWTLIEMRQALVASTVAEMPPAPAWSRLMPGAAKSAFDLAGESYYRLEDILAQANQPRHWDEAVQRMDALLLWASGTAWKGLAECLRTELITGTRTADWVLVRLTCQVCPTLPLTWRGLDLSDTHAQASLAGLAQQALTSNTPDFTLLRQLYKADLRGALTVPG